MLPKKKKHSKIGASKEKPDLSDETETQTRKVSMKTENENTDNPENKEIPMENPIENPVSSIGITDLAEVSKSQVPLYFIPVEKMEVDPIYNTRTYFESEPEFAELMASIKKSGVKRPMSARLDNGKIIVVEGHRRHAACMALIKKGVEVPPVPCTLFVGDERDRDYDLYRSNCAVPLSSLSLGRMFVRRRKAGETTKQIADETGFKVAQIAKFIRFATAPASVQMALETRQATEALVWSAMNDCGKDLALLESTVKAAIQKAQALGKKKAGAKEKPKVEGKKPRKSKASKTPANPENPENPQVPENKGGKKPLPSIDLSELRGIKGADKYLAHYGNILEKKPDATQTLKAAVQVIEQLRKQFLMDIEKIASIQVAEIPQPETPAASENPENPNPETAVENAENAENAETPEPELS